MATQPQLSALGSCHLVLLLEALELYSSNCFNTLLNSHLSFESRLYQLNWHGRGEKEEQVLHVLRHLLARRALHPQATVFFPGGFGKTLWKAAGDHQRQESISFNRCMNSRWGQERFGAEPGFCLASSKLRVRF